MISNFINKYSDLAAYNADETKEYPNVSYLETEDIVKWQATEPIDQEHIVAKYDVTSTSSATKILNNVSNITYMIVDGVQQPSVATGFTFSTTGEHTVKYKVNSSWNGQYGFDSCNNLTNITIPSGVTSIGINAFKYCNGLTSVTISDSVTLINTGSFYGSGLRSVTIGSGIEFILGDAFQFNSRLASITINAITPPSTNGTEPFNYTNNCPIYVPAASVNAYKTAANWSTYASRIQAIQ